MKIEEYKALFAEIKETKDLKEGDTRAGRALTLALDIRKFEIELYWKRATYFWAFIGASFAGYALTSKSTDTQSQNLLLVFSALGTIFSFTWYLVNRGSKFWQNNWERHVDMLEDLTLGPLYKMVVLDDQKGNPLTAPGEFSVSKLNQILSIFVLTVWLALFYHSLGPITSDLRIDSFKISITAITAAFIIILWLFGKSSNKATSFTIRPRKSTPH
ncbi:hypothetical protein [Variovorax guangxiensis]|uniref:RipA family octameric membrane protein n=1 Tax=Variovorax guangxiensis TaxID=1775474 RepID=UPI001127BEE2|nr:hypothetical protein [Variovorax guangxiensis]